MSDALDTILGSGPVIAVLTIDDAADALPIAEALLAGGVRVMEVTLRTAAAADAITAMRRADRAIVGAGTVLNAADAARAIDAGATFLVSPGLSDAVIGAAKVPLLPGVATSTEIMRALDAGLTSLKFFPAEAAGGASAVAAYAGPFPRVRFCPTGGITPALAPSYWRLANVACVGGSWLAPKDVVARKDWREISARAAAALASALS